MNPVNKLDRTLTSPFYSVCSGSSCIKFFFSSPDCLQLIVAGLLLQVADFFTSSMYKFGASTQRPSTNPLYRLVFQINGVYVHVPFKNSILFLILFELMIYPWK
jgi:hypothetical protein